MYKIPLDICFTIWGAGRRQGVKALAVNEIRLFKIFVSHYKTSPPV